MKKLLIIAAFLLAPAVMATDCPCGDNPPFVCCGKLTCDIFQANATYVMGGSCSPHNGYYCCVNGGPFRKSESVERAVPLLIQFMEQGNKPFSGLTNGVHVRMVVNGQQVPGKMGQGRFVDGYLEMKDGTRYLVLAGDLLRVND